MPAAARQGPGNVQRYEKELVDFSLPCTRLQPTPCAVGLIRMNLAPGTRLGRYEIRAHIGTGGMGEIYQAADIELERTVALKVLPEDFASDPTRMRRFVQ